MSAQGSYDWFMERLGMITASRFSDVLAGGDRRRDYLMQLMHERITGIPAMSISSRSLAWGHQHESDACDAIEERTGWMLEPSGFVVMDGEPNIGCSPDRFAVIDGERVGFEIKCPYNGANHLMTIIAGMPIAHTPQVQGGMMCTGYKRWVFSSFDPRIGSNKRLYLQEVKKDEVYQKKLLDPIKEFEAEMLGLLRALGD